RRVEGGGVLRPPRGPFVGARGGEVLAGQPSQGGAEGRADAAPRALRGRRLPKQGGEERRDRLRVAEVAERVRRREAQRPVGIVQQARGPLEVRRPRGLVVRSGVREGREREQRLEPHARVLVAERRLERRTGEGA